LSFRLSGVDPGGVPPASLLPGAPSVAAERASSAAGRRENYHSSGEIERFRM